MLLLAVPHANWLPGEAGGGKGASSKEAPGSFDSCDKSNWDQQFLLSCFSCEREVFSVRGGVVSCMIWTHGADPETWPDGTCQWVNVAWPLCLAAGLVLGDVHRQQQISASFQ